MSRKDNKNRVLKTGESQRKDGTYMYRYTDSSGKRRCVYAPELSELRKKEKEIQRDNDDGIRTDLGKRSLNEQFDIFIESKTKLRPRTIVNYKNMWDFRVRETVFGMRSIDSIKRSDIIKFYKYLSDEGLKFSSIKIIDIMVFGAFEMAVNDDILRKNPCKGCYGEVHVDDSTKKESLTKKQQDALLNYVESHHIYGVYHPMLTFMIETGLRCGEVIGLTWKDVHFDEKYIVVDHQLIYEKLDGKYKFYAGPTKTKAGARTIPLSDAAIKALQRQRKTQFALGHKTNVEIDGYSDFVFSTKNRNPIMPSAVNNILKNIVNSYNKNNEKEEMPHISAHILRHTGCTRMSEAGIDPKVLQYVMGHNSIIVSMDVYNHVSLERAVKEMHKMYDVV